MEPSIISNKIFNLMGCVFYGDPFHSAQEWSYDNEIGKVWGRFMNLSQKYASLINRINKNPKIGYELHLEPEEYNETGKYYILVGIEVLETLDIPLEMFLKILPKTNYIHFTTKVKNANLEVQKVYEDWIPDNGFEEVYPYMIESYHSDRYKGLDDLESQIDWYIPVKKEAC